MDAISITSIIISILAALGVLVARMKCKHCRMGCIDGDCISTPEASPRASIQSFARPSFQLEILPPSNPPAEDAFV
jgi:hypothetical protein